MLKPLENLVRRVGEELLLLRETTAIQGTWQGTQLKTLADQIAHERLVEGLSLLGGAIPILSEEDTASLINPRPDTYWLIDPIDGTASYAGGFSGFVVQVALMVQEQPILAAIYAPALNELYVAGLGNGATLNCQRLYSKLYPGRRILIDNYPTPRATAHHVYRALQCTGYLESGSMALKICRVADGRADLFFKDVAVRDWDIAAPQLVLAEAKGQLSLLDGAPFAYEGEYEKPGVLAVSSAQLGCEFVEWYKNVGCRPGGDDETRSS